MLDDLTLVDGSTPLPYSEPEGTRWREKLISKTMIENAIEKNRSYLTTKLKNKKYSEVFLAIGKQYGAALPDFTKYQVKVIFPASGGLGPKAQALKEWLCSKSTTNSTKKNHF
jgi:hypothetical protein